MYITVCINDGGYIRLPGYGGRMIHKETRGLHQSEVCSPALNDLRWKIRGKVGYGVRGILELDNQGGGSAIWTQKCDVEYWTDKLKIWKGCYGAWPVKTMS